MALDYSALLTNEQKRNILDQRITSFAADAYANSINKKSAEALGDADAAATAQANIDTLTKAIEVHQEELARLENAIA